MPLLNMRVEPQEMNTYRYQFGSDRGPVFPRAVSPGARRDPHTCTVHIRRGRDTCRGMGVHDPAHGSRAARSRVPYAVWARSVALVYAMGHECLKSSLAFRQPPPGQG